MCEASFKSFEVVPLKRLVAFGIGISCFFDEFVELDIVVVDRREVGLFNGFEADCCVNLSIDFLEGFFELCLKVRPSRIGTRGFLVCVELGSSPSVWFILEIVEDEQDFLFIRLVFIGEVYFAALEEVFGAYAAIELGRCFGILTKLEFLQGFDQVVECDLVAHCGFGEGLDCLLDFLPLFFWDWYVFRVLWVGKRDFFFLRECWYL